MPKQSPYQIAVALLVCALPLCGGVISVQTPTSPVFVGQTFSVSVIASSVADLYAYQFDLGFNPAILSVVSMSISEGPFLRSGGGTAIFVPGTINNVAGTIDFSADSLVGAIPGVTGSGTLEMVQFRALAPGTTAVNTANVTLLDSALNSIAGSTAGATVSVQNVPEPAAWRLAGLGIGLIVCYWYRCQVASDRSSS